MKKDQWTLLGAVFLITSIAFFFASLATVNVILGWVVYGAFGMAFFALAIASWVMYVVEYGSGSKQADRKKRR